MEYTREEARIMFQLADDALNNEEVVLAHLRVRKACQTDMYKNARSKQETLISIKKKLSEELKGYGNLY